MVLAVAVGRVDYRRPKERSARAASSRKRCRRSPRLILLDDPNSDIGRGVGQLPQVAGHGCLQAEADQEFRGHRLLGGDGRHEAPNLAGLLSVVNQRQRRDTVARVR